MLALKQNQVQIEEIQARIKAKQEHLAALERANDKLNLQISCMNEWMTALKVKPHEISDPEMIKPSFELPPSTELIIDYSDKSDRQAVLPPLSVEPVNRLFDVIATLKQAILVYCERISPLIVQVKAAEKVSVGGNTIPSVNLPTELKIKELFGKEYLSDKAFVDFLKRLEVDEFEAVVVKYVGLELDWSEIKTRVKEINVHVDVDLEALSAECNSYLDLVEKYIN